MAESAVGAALRCVECPKVGSDTIWMDQMVRAEIVTTFLTKPNNSEDNSIPIPGTISHSPSTVGSIYTSTTSVPSITAKSSLSPDPDSSMRVPINRNPDYTTSQDKSINVKQNGNGSIDKRFIANDISVEKNTNPEIEKIEQEILTTLKRLGGDNEDNVSYNDDDDDGGSGSSDHVGDSDNASGGVDNTDTTVKKPYKKSKEFDRLN